MQVRSLGQENPSGEENGNLLQILAWEIPWTVSKESGSLQSMGSQKSCTLEWLHNNNNATDLALGSASYLMSCVCVRVFKAFSYHHPRPKKHFKRTVALATIAKETGRLSTQVKAGYARKKLISKPPALMCKYPFKTIHFKWRKIKLGWN